MRVLFCPAHYLYDDAREGSELSWVYNIGDRVASLFPTSVIVTGRSTVDDRPYRIVELTPRTGTLDIGITHALSFNARYTWATFRALRQGRFHVVHHVLPFAFGRTFNLAALRHGKATPFVIGPIQPRLAIPDADVDPADVRSAASPRANRFGSGPRPAARALGALLSVVARPALSKLSHQTLAAAAAVVVVNETTRKMLIRSGIPSTRIVVIPPGIDAKRFRPSEKPSKRRNITLLSVCHLVRRKNVDVIIAAFARLLQAAPDAELRVVGDGPQREALMHQAHALGVGRKVTFLGSIPHAKIHEAYAEADVFVNASAAEGFATVCLEALASGLPVVSTKVGGFLDAVVDDHNGYLVKTTDPQELAEALRRLVMDGDLVDTLSRRARDVARSRFDWERSIIPKYIELYESVIRERTA